MEKTELIGSKEAAARLNMPRSTFNLRVHDGLIPYVAKLPGVTAPYLFDPRDIDDIADNAAAGELHKDNPHRVANPENEAA